MPQQDVNKYYMEISDIDELRPKIKEIPLYGFKNLSKMFAIIYPSGNSQPISNHQGAISKRQEIVSLSLNKLVYNPVYYFECWYTNNETVYSPVLYEYPFSYIVIEFY